MDFQSTLFEAPASGLTTFEAVERRPLSHGAWVDVLRAWVPDADDVFTTLVREVPWKAERRQMYERLVDVPRLLHTYMIGEELPHPLLTEARDALSAHYADELGEPFRTAGCCYYRDGRDSVAWHGDRIGRGNTHDTMVAIVSLGDPRRLALRPAGRRRVDRHRDGPRRPGGDGRLLPAHLGARRAEGRARRAAGLGAVPPAQRLLTLGVGPAAAARSRFGP